MACEIVINAKRRKQSWENKYAMLGMEGRARRSQGESRLAGGEGASGGGKSTLGRRNRKCKGPEVRDA